MIFKFGRIRLNYVMYLIVDNIEYSKFNGLLVLVHKSKIPDAS